MRAARPAGDHESGDRLGARRAERRAGRGDARIVQRLPGVAARIRLDLVALDAHRPPLALRAVEEGLGEGADDRRHAHGGAPAAVIPLDAVAGRQLVLRGAGAGLDAVDEEEPVAGAARAGALEAVDRLDEAAAEASVDVELRAQHAHDGLILPQRVEADGAELLVAEVASHAKLGAALLLLAGAETAAGEEEGDRDQYDKEEPRPHGTSTRSVNDRTSP